MQTISPLSTEYIRVPVHALGYTVSQIKACTVYMAICEFGVIPGNGDWRLAAWAEGDVPYAIRLVGPGVQHQLDEHTSYDVWLKIYTPSPASYIAIVRSGTIRTSGPLIP